VLFVEKNKGDELAYKFDIEIATAKSSILTNPLITKSLKQFRESQNFDSRDELRKTLNERLLMQYDPIKAQLDQRVTELESAHRSIPPPTDVVRFPWPNNDEGRAAYHAHKADVKRKWDEALVEVEKRRALRESTFSEDATKLCTALVDGISLFKPIEAQIKEVTATAVSASGTKYSIPIVVPIADPVQD
jgi:hypothetical protein